MLEWAAEQRTEITTTAIDLEFLPTGTNAEGGLQNLEFCGAADAHSIDGAHELDIVANSRKNPLEAG